MSKITTILTIFSSFLMMNTAMSQTKRYVKPVATGNGNGLSWYNASGNLQAMIDASADNDEVWVAKGTYRPTVTVGYNNAHVAYTDDRHKSFYLKTGVKLFGGFAGTESSMGQRKLALNKTILSGDFSGNDAGFVNNNENAYHVVVAISAHAVSLDGFSITGGNTTGMPATYLNDDPVYTQIPADGAGIYSYNNDLSVANSIFTNHYTNGNGGAICNYSFDQQGSYIGCLFINNRAAQGSAIYVGGTENASNDVISSTFFNNISSGATLYTAFGLRFNIWNSIVWNNTVVGAQANLNSYFSIIQLYLTNGGGYPQNGTSQADPLFINAADPDGVDNILGTADDGLIPQCGPAIGTGYNNVTMPAKDIRDAIRIQNGGVDLGVYETSLVHEIAGIGISVYYYTPRDPDDATTENDLPAIGACEGSGVTFTASTSGNGGAFQWKKNGIPVGTNSPFYAPTDFHANDQVKVEYQNVAGCGPASLIQSNTIVMNNVSVAKPVIPTAVMGPANPCPYINAAPVAYKINKAPGAVIYYWKFSVPGGHIVSHPNGPGVNDTIVLVAFTPGFTTGKITVMARNWCGWSSTKYISLTAKIPPTAGVISGPADVCPFVPSVSNPSGINVTYSIRKVTDASSYTWNAPAGATIVSHPGTGENDTVVVVNYGSGFVSGILSVQAVNFCGARSARSLSISKKASGTPASVLGPTAVCAFMPSAGNPSGVPVNYTIKKVLYATSYTWTLPAGASAIHPAGSGINDTIITVTYSGSFAGGVITVKSNTNCSTSGIRSLSIPFSLPSTPGTITASAPTACPQQRISYSLASLPSRATSVWWSVPATATIISGQGTLSLLVEFGGPTTITDTIRVVGVNDCGTSGQRKLKVGILPACRAGRNGIDDLPPAVTKTNTVPLSTAGVLDITVMPNPSQQHFTLQLKGHDRMQPLNLQVMDATGKIIDKKILAASAQQVILGDAYKPGIYFAILVQGEQKKIVRLIKL